MERDELYSAVREKENMLSTAFPALMNKVYTWMALALVITGMTAYGFASTGLTLTIISNQVVFWGLIIAEFALVWSISGAIDKMSLATATLLFIL